MSAEDPAAAAENDESENNKDTVESKISVFAGNFKFRPIVRF
jgi:hypothetical protein